MIVTLKHSAPPSRADGIPYTTARVEEASVEAGPWSPIDSLTITPVDGDPSHPVSRELTTTKATLTEGWYRVIWIDGGENESSPTAAIQNLAELAGGPRPTVTDVAALLRARTKIIGGKELGTFTDLTRPTADEVDDLIDEALDDVLGKVQPPEPDTAYERRVRGAVRLYTAVLIETSYFPEQVAGGKSPASTYENLYKSRIKALIAEGETGSPQGEGGGDAPGDPYWAFPQNAGGMIGNGTRW